MEPFRTAAYRCPSCDVAPLREFHDRMICDACFGILIDEADLASACSDLLIGDATLQFADATPSDKACPRCELALTACELQIRPGKAKADVLRCERDGVWLAGGVMTKLFARLGRFTTMRGGGITQRGAGSEVGLDGLPTSRHDASGGLAIAAWRSRPRRRTKTVTPINVYADRTLVCPACTASDLVFMADRWSCPSCAGTFVQNAALEALVMDMAGELWSLPAPGGTPGARRCPVCAEPMLVETLDGVTIDRCTAHGAWFDARELAVTLEHASGQFDTRGIRGWLARLFR